MEPTPRGAGRTGSRLHQPHLATGLGREWDLTAVLFPAAEPLRTEPEDKVSGAAARPFLHVLSLPPGDWPSTSSNHGHSGKTEDRGLPPPLSPVQWG